MFPWVAAVWCVCAQHNLVNYERKDWIVSSLCIFECQVIHLKKKKKIFKMQKHRFTGTMSLIFSSLCESRQQTADCETLLAVSAMSHNEWVSERAKCTLSERHQFNGATRTKVPISSDILAWWVTGVRRVPPLISFIQKRPIFPPSAIGSTPPTPPHPLGGSTDQTALCESH